jgi:hypothetical protein
MVLIDDRWESTFALAIRLGFHAERFGFAGRIGSNVSPSYSESVPVGHATDHDFVRAPALFLQLSAGYAIWATDGFVSTPSLSVLRTDNPAYGTALGLEWPFIWVTHRRLRIGFEPGFWAAFGGYQVAYCNDPTAGCAQDARVELGRPFGYGLSCNFVFGFELGRS